jgi:G3E family GTPase
VLEDTAPSLPVTVIAGYLGSGKTTLINRLLATQEGQRLAVLVNDFGAINIDAELIDSTSERTISLTNGCVCCVIGDDLGGALRTLADDALQLDHVLLEASGVADGARLGDIARSWPGYCLAQVVTLVDVSRIRSLFEDKFIGRHIRRQLTACDRLLLSKIDLVSAVALADCRRWLESISAVPIAPVDAPTPAELLSVSGDQFRLADPAASPSHPALESLSFTGERPISRCDFETWLAGLPDAVLRAKGFVVFRETPDQSYLLQVVDGAVELTPHARPPDQGGSLLVIGRDLSGISDPFQR